MNPTDTTGAEGPPSGRRTGLYLVLGLVLVAGLVALFASQRAPTAGERGPAGRTARFEDRARAAGIDFKMAFLPEEQGVNFKINLYDHGCGVAVADYDADGDDDLYFCNQLGPNALYRNDGKGQFTDVTAAAGGVGVPDRISVAATFGDVDGDGDQDLYVTTTRGGNVFFRNLGGGTFADETEKAGLSLVAHSQTPVLFDADGDGDLDLLVTNTAKWTMDDFDEKARYYPGAGTIFQLVDSPKEQNRYYRNKGDGTFEDATAESGLAGVGWGGDAAVFDFDGDGDLDVFVSNMFGSSGLYRNDGKARFELVTKQALGKTSWGTVGTRAFDYDGDGLLDLMLVDMHSDMWMDPSYEPTTYPESQKFLQFDGPNVATGVVSAETSQKFKDHLGYKEGEVIFGNTLFHNLGNGTFEETSEKANLETLWPWGIAVADFDGDGFEDVFLPSGMGYPYKYLRSPLLMNDGNGGFRDRSRVTGIDPPLGGRYLEGKLGGKEQSRSSRSAATGDFDGDGRPDLVVNNFNDRPFLLMNRWPAKPYVALRLRGSTSNRDAIGALVTVHAGGRKIVRQVQSSGGYLSQSSKTLTIGLGDATKVDRVEIRWPSGRVQTLEGLEVGRRHDVVEPTK